MRAFDVLTKAEYEIRGSMQPRYHLEMALLRWIHLRKLVPLTDLIKQMEGGARAVGAPAPRPAAAPVTPAAPPPRPAPPAPMAAPKFASASEVIRPASPKLASASEGGRAAAPGAEAGSTSALQAVDPAILKESFLSEVKKAKKFFFGTVVAQAQKIEFEGDKVVFTFAPQHRALRAQLEQNRAFLEIAASQLAGRKITVGAAEGSAGGDPPSPAKAGFGETAAALKTGDAAAGFGETAPAPANERADAGGAQNRQQALKERALSDTGVQTMLDVFAAEIKDVEEM
jgi:hypothetical protein